LKSDGKGFLLSRKQEELPEYPVTKNVVNNNIAEATNVIFSSKCTFGEGSLIVGDKVIADSGLDYYFSGYLLLNKQRISNKTAENKQARCNAGHMQKPRIIKETAYKWQRFGNQIPNKR
jgi:hypothetical protein